MSEPRPDLTMIEPCKPDVLVRLQARLNWWRNSPPVPNEEDDALTTHMDVSHEDLLTDAIDAIKGLRDSDARRLTMIADLKRELAELRPSEGR